MTAYRFAPRSGKDFWHPTDTAHAFKAALRSRGLINLHLQSLTDPLVSLPPRKPRRLTKTQN